MATVLMLCILRCCYNRQSQMTLKTHAR